MFLVRVGFRAVRVLLSMHGACRKAARVSSTKHEWIRSETTKTVAACRDRSTRCGGELSGGKVTPALVGQDSCLSFTPAGNRARWPPTRDSLAPPSTRPPPD